MFRKRFLLPSSVSASLTVTYSKSQPRYKVTDKTAPYLRQLVAGFPPRRTGFEPRSDHVGFVVNEAALGQVFSEYFGFPCQAFHRLLHTNHHTSSGAGTTDQIVADVPSGLTSSKVTKKERLHLTRCLREYDILIGSPSDVEYIFLCRNNADFSISKELGR
jgi:hypothetical protein